MPNGTKSYDEWMDLKPDAKEYAIYEILALTEKVLKDRGKSCPFKATILWNKWISRSVIATAVVGVGVAIIRRFV